MSQTNTDYLRLAAYEAIRTWDLSERQICEDTKNTSDVTIVFLKKWLGYWMLARSNPLHLREKLSLHLQQSTRPSLIAVQDENLPNEIEKLSLELYERGATKGRQTSLVSKFAFCLRPQIAVPYDKRARDGLMQKFGIKLEDHDYPAYFRSFSDFSEKTANELHRTGLLGELEEKWEALMTRDLFRRRTADKLLMLEGGFSSKSMEVAVEKYLSEQSPLS
tara:strand:+ start:368 stop:1027 length:660 start_codon:yes stop_codon:yes gene_type:complete